MNFYKSLLAIITALCFTCMGAHAQRLSDSFIPVTPPDVPASMTFCGDKVSFDRIDMAERMDRELTGIVYGQTLSSIIIKRANRYFPRLIEILKKNNMPEDLIYLAVAESSLDINALSPAKAAGIWQSWRRQASNMALRSTTMWTSATTPRRRR